MVNHLVKLATDECALAESEFFRDLKATYDYLNEAPHVHEAVSILKRKYSDCSIWLNVNTSLENICQSKIERENIRDGLRWLSSNQFIEGISYDLPHYGLYRVKVSIEPYQNLIRSSGMKVATGVEAESLQESDERHSDIILHHIQATRGPEAACDMAIIIDRKTYFVHLVVLASFSSYFRTIESISREGRTHVLNLDTESELETSEGDVLNGSTTPSKVTAESVASVIHWIYNECLDISDTNLANNKEVNLCLNQYLNILRLADIWDIPSLKIHVENRILTKANTFIRVENVRAVRDIAKQCNAREVENQCRKFQRANNAIVDVISSAPDADDEQARSYSESDRDEEQTTAKTRSLWVLKIIPNVFDLWKTQKSSKG